jgi:hypothetical protein
VYGLIEKIQKQAAEQLDHHGNESVIKPEN